MLAVELCLIISCWVKLAHQVNMTSSSGTQSTVSMEKTKSCVGVLSLMTLRIRVSVKLSSRISVEKVLDGKIKLTLNSNCRRLTNT